MQYVIVAMDGTDDEALNRRLAVREDHIEGAKKMKEEGTLIKGGAILDDEGNMAGSVAFVEFETRDDLDHWLKTDPYVTGGVWQDIDVKPFRVAI